MVFSSLSFLLIFLPLVLGLYYLLPGKIRNGFLFTASIGFYALGEPRYVFLFLAVIAWTWLAGLAIGHTENRVHAKILLASGLVGVLGVLCVFKYTAFAADIFRTFTGASLPVVKLALPIGISFYTFQAVSYMADVYRGEPAQKNVICLGLYLSFFPQLIAGPIVRYGEMASRIRERHTTAEDLTVGIMHLTGGLCRKVLLANTLGQLADHVFEANGQMQAGTALLWMGAIAYTLQIYFDFSGYSEMAIGLGRLFGFRLPENFRDPYLAATATDFWRRWHITLSRWFRDYVYIPLGGSRKGRARQCVNLLIVWALTGLWHGAGWTFLAWGLLWGMLLVLEKNLIQPDRHGNGFRRIYRVFILVCVVLSWVVFRSGSIADAAE